jgi:hypothetical protein
MATTGITTAVKDGDNVTGKTNWPGDFFTGIKNYCFVFVTTGKQ